MSYNMIDIPHFSLDECCGVSLEQDIFLWDAGFSNIMS